MVKDDIVVNLENRRVVVVEASASEVELNVLVLSPLLRHCCCQYFGPRPWRSDVFIRVINMELSDSEPVWPARQEVEEAMEPDHSQGSDGAVPPVAVLYHVHIEVGVVHEIARRVVRMLGGAQLCVIPGAHFNLGVVVKAAVLEGDPCYLDGVVCGTRFCVVGPARPRALLLGIIPDFLPRASEPTVGQVERQDREIVENELESKNILQELDHRRGHRSNSSKF